jgi:glutamyl/glutaminyl-tRNA synthetase
VPIVTGATRTRFAPAPTGRLHLGHVANALWTWGFARAAGASVLLRIEDHDRQRSHATFDRAILDDLDWLGFIADAGLVRQSDPDAQAAYAAASRKLADQALVYGCDCSRATFARWHTTHGATWSGPGCPGGCRERGVAGPVLRVALGAGVEGWIDELLGMRSGPVASGGDLPIRDRHGNWTYGFCVTVDDQRQGVDLVVRGQDLLEATPVQIRLGRVLGRAVPATFAHHPLIRRADGSKLSKSDGDTGIEALRAAGLTREAVLARAADATGYRGERPSSGAGPDRSSISHA